MGKSTRPEYVMREGDLPDDFQISLEYIAGWFDGEGTAGFHYDKRNKSRNAQLAFWNTDIVVLKKMAEFIREKYGIKCKINHRSYKNRNCVDEFGFNICSRRNIRIIGNELLKRCITKRKAIIDVLTKLHVINNGSKEFEW